MDLSFMPNLTGDRTVSQWDISFKERLSFQLLQHVHTEQDKLVNTIFENINKVRREHTKESIRWAEILFDQLQADKLLRIKSAHFPIASLKFSMLI